MLGVTALIAIAAFVIYGFVVAGVQANAEHSRILNVASSLKASLGVLNDYSGLGTGYPGSGSVNNVALGYLKGPYNATTTDVSNAWGGKIYLNMYRDGWILNGSSNGVWVLTQYDIPQSVCVKLLSDLTSNPNQFLGVATTSPGSSSYSWVQISDSAWSSMKAAYGFNMTKQAYLGASVPSKIAQLCGGDNYDETQVGITVFGS